MRDTWRMAIGVLRKEPADPTSFGSRFSADEKYLGCKQRLPDAVNDRIGINLSEHFRTKLNISNFLSSQTREFQKPQESASKMVWQDLLIYI